MIPKKSCEFATSYPKGKFVSEVLIFPLKTGEPRLFLFLEIDSQMVGDRPFAAGDVVWIPPNEMHQFQNTSAEPVEFICLIPAPHECALGA
jgi:hypothetical protein